MIEEMEEMLVDCKYWIPNGCLFPPGFSDITGCPAPMTWRNRCTYIKLTWSSYLIHKGDVVIKK